MQKEEIKEVISAWSVTKVHSITTPNTGKVNTTIIIDSPQGKFAFRKYNHTDQLRVQRVNAVIQFAAAHGIPAVCPIPTQTGENILLLPTGLYALFPYIQGEHPTRDTLHIKRIEEMGRFLGQLHNVLKVYPLSQVPERHFQVNPEETLTVIKALKKCIEEREGAHPTDAYALKRLKGKKAWIESGPQDPIPNLQRMEQQVIHGDYQVSNLFYYDDTIKGIIDWDGTSSAPRLWEVVRCLDYEFGFQIEPSLVFLRKYNAGNPIDLHQLNLMAHCYGYVEDQKLWAFQAVYFRGEDRARIYLKPGEFIPIVKRWEPLWTCLSDTQLI
jgi:Ser/Thr protein kinase RdoA (MazF antagonist)